MADETSYSEREVRDLENEIRKLGTPYELPKPNAAYWANFRTRVMESVEPKPSSVHRAVEWLAQHLIGSSLVGVGLAAALFVGVFGLPNSDPTQPVVHPQAIATVEQPAVKASIEPKTEHQVAVASKLQISKKQKNARAVSPENDDNNFASATPAMESVAQPLLISSESEYPVSLNELSESELQSVYEGLMSLDSAD